MRSGPNLVSIDALHANELLSIFFLSQLSFYFILMPLV